MANIELLIKVDKAYYDRIKDMVNIVLGTGDTAIANGIPLPKGHGDLIDRNDLFKKKYCIEDEWNGGEIDIVDAIDIAMANTIIKADKER